MSLWSYWTPRHIASKLTNSLIGICKSLKLFSIILSIAKNTMATLSEISCLRQAKKLHWHKSCLILAKRKEVLNVQDPPRWREVTKNSEFAIDKCYFRIHELYRCFGRTHDGSWPLRALIRCKSLEDSPRRLVISCPHIHSFIFLFIFFFSCLNSYTLSIRLLEQDVFGLTL